MHQIKLFEGVENELKELEEGINMWLAEADVRIVQMVGNIAPQTIPFGASSRGLSNREFAPSDVLLAILYEKNLG